MSFFDWFKVVFCGYQVSKVGTINNDNGSRFSFSHNNLDAFNIEQPYTDKDGIFYLLTLYYRDGFFVNKKLRLSDEEIEKLSKSLTDSIR